MFSLNVTTDPLLADDGTHAAAIAALPPLDEQRRAAIAALVRAS